MPCSPELSAAELEAVTPLLLRMGVGALGWWKIRRSHLRRGGVALQLQQAYRLYSVKNALSEQRIQTSVSLLRSAGVEPILIKGWAVARLYPESGLRPYGDIDLCVPPEQFDRARDALGDTKVKFQIDLQEGLGKLDVEPLENLYSRSILVKLGDVNVRVLGAEDHLRVLCVHMLTHDFHRPLWLCDIAAVVESLPQEFDWGVCLGKNRKRAGWVLSAIGLARQMLGAETSGEVPKGTGERLPRWFVSSVEKQWEAPPDPHRVYMRHYLRHLSGLLKDLRRRWPDPTGATIRVGGPINRLPRLPFQLGDCLLRTTKFVGQLPRLLHHQ